MGRAAAASSTNEIEIVPKKLLCPGCISSANIAAGARRILAM
jgi:hypothetical protein